MIDIKKWFSYKKNRMIAAYSAVGLVIVIMAGVFAFKQMHTPSEELDNLSASIEQEVTAESELTSTDEPTAIPNPSLPPNAEPKVSVEEAKVIKQEQAKVVEQAKKEEAKAEKAVADKVVTSSVAKSAPIPAGFPVQNVPIMQGAQIESASKNVNTYNMVQKVNVPPEDSYKYYFDLYDAIGSAKITSKTDNKSLSIEMSKKGLKIDLSFDTDGENKSTITMKIIEEL